MPAIPPELRHRLHETLARCNALESDRALRALFVDARLALWINRVPENTSDRAARVGLLIAALCDKPNAHGENALVLLLHVLAESTPADDGLHGELADLAHTLESLPPADLATLTDWKPAPAVSQTDIHDSQIGVVGDHAHIEGGIHQHKHYHTTPPANAREARNRATMLQLVHNTWIEGVLNQSLHGAAMLELGKEYTPDAVERPWDMDFHMPDQERRPVPHGTPILDLFDQASGALLILGEPGSGKTTTLLQLAQALITRAENDDTAPIPVVFNLSSWAVKQQALESWLIDELRTKYRIPKRVAQSWIEQDTLLLLLDGLDEVKPEARDQCVVAINAFRQAYLVPLAMCSRVADYTALTAKLRLQGAICIRPLTPVQSDAYLAGAGTELQAVRATLQHDPILQELAQSPLFLSIMTLAYRGQSIADLHTLTTPEARRQHLFDTYIERMFQRRAKDTAYTPEQTRHWLAWLAGQLVAHNQTVFYIENLQPTWLPALECRRARRLARLGVGLFFGLFLGLFLGLVYGPVYGLGVGLVYGLGVGLVYGVVYGLGGGLVGGLVSGLFFGLVGGLALGLGGRLDEVKPVETLMWSWQKAREGLVAGLSFMLGVGLFGGLFFGLIGGPGRGLIGGLTGGLVGGLVWGLFLGLSNAKIDFKTVPNQGIRWSFRNALGVGLGGGLVGGVGVGLVCGLVFGLGNGLFWGLFWGLSFGLFFGLVVGLIAGLSNQGGGGAVILHYTLRAILARTNRAPWNYARFLDHCVDRILLRKVGGGYIFIHRLLMEHFAAMDTTPEQ